MIQTPRSVSLIMDKNFIFVVIAASICGCYNNEANRPEPFQGRFAKAIENHRFPKTIQKPHWLNHYEVISAPAGNIYKHILYHIFNHARNSMIQLLIGYILILFQGEKILWIHLFARLLEMQPIVWKIR